MKNQKSLEYTNYIVDIALPNQQPFSLDSLVMVSKKKNLLYFSLK